VSTGNFPNWDQCFKFSAGLWHFLLGDKRSILPATNLLLLSLFLSFRRHELSWSNFQRCFCAAENLLYVWSLTYGAFYHTVWMFILVLSTKPTDLRQPNIVQLSKKFLICCCINRTVLYKSQVIIICVNIVREYNSFFMTHQHLKVHFFAMKLCNRNLERFQNCKCLSKKKLW